MISTIFGIRSSDPDQRSRGLLLKCITLVIGLSVIVSLILTRPSNPNAILIIAGDVIMLLLSASVFALAHYGRVATGALVLCIPLMFCIFALLPHDQILDRPSMVILFFPTMIVGLTIHARAAAAFAGMTIFITISMLILQIIPFTSWTPVALLLLVMTTVFIWLIIFSLERGRNDARAQAATIQKNQDLLIARERELQENNQEMQEKNAQLETALSLVQQLEVPIIPLIAGAVVVPLVGYLDTRRMENIQQNILSSVHTNNTRFVLIDLTGIAQLDTDSTVQFRQLVQSITLLGAKTLLTGISAEIAMSLVENQIDIDSIWTSSTLSNAIRHVLQHATA